jgi:gliding motility-associated-like protein/uncharacterized repeat protein (TIGR02543 family)
MKKIPAYSVSFLLFVFSFITLCTVQVRAQDQCTVVGWASENGGVTGGGTATPTVVTTYNELKAALTSASVKVVHVSGTITIPSGGRISFQNQSGKTIYGLPGSKIESHDQTKDGSGILYIKNCSNFIFKNLTFEGPGAYDVDGWDNMTLDNCKNVWVDHCEYQDGIDGNLDVKNASDYISITWCKFIYKKAPIPDGPGGADDHRFSDLFGSGDGATGDRGKLRITLQHCWWAQGCVARMPRVRFGKVHVVNNLFNSTVAAQCVMAGFEANILVESNVFENVKKPIDLMDNNFTAITVKSDNVFNNTTGNTAGSGTAFTPPYTLKITPTSDVKSLVMAGAGATLTSPTCDNTTSYTLNTTASPAAGGTVSGAGSYMEGSAAIITATPATGYTFTGWSGDASGSSTSTTVAMTSNKSVTANFQLQSYTLSTTASPAAGGTVTGAGSYTYGTTATLKATPAAGYIFTGWSGDASGTSSSTTVTINSNKSVTANFQLQSYTLSTTASPAAGGTVTGAGSYTYGTTATLKATPAAGYVFTGWSGDASGTSATTTVTINSNKSVTAKFQLQSYTLSTVASPAAGGTVTGAGSYTYGTTATLKATPAAGYIFTGWSGDASGTSSSTTVTMNGDKSVTANFQAQSSTTKYTLGAAASPSAGGTVTGAGSYDAGAVVTLTATAAAGYTFTGWGGDASGTSTSATVTMSGNKSVTANFQLQNYTLSTTSSPTAGGTVTGAGTYTYGTTVTLKATPAAGYIFTGWSDDASGTSSSTTVTMNGNKSVTAKFQAQATTIKFTLSTTATPAAGGAVSGAGSYDAGTEVTLTATPAAGYTFTGWSGDASGTSVSTTITMTGNKSATANFQAQTTTITYTLSATVVPSEGGVVTGKGTYDAGTTVTLIATPASGYIFTGWSGDISDASASVAVTMNSNKSVTANFQAQIVTTTEAKPAKLFSPDNRGDMSTETWKIENAYLLNGCEIVIYNRQGQKVYTSIGYTTPWDGTSNGKPLPDGAYFYVIHFPDNTKKTGSVTIARLK